MWRQSVLIDEELDIIRDDYEEAEMDGIAQQGTESVTLRATDEIEKELTAMRETIGSLRARLGPALRRTDPAAKLKSAEVDDARPESEIMRRLHALKHGIVDQRKELADLTDAIEI